jgi:hypothetical protein
VVMVHISTCVVFYGGVVAAVKSFDGGKLFGELERNHCSVDGILMSTKLAMR